MTLPDLPAAVFDNGHNVDEDSPFASVVTRWTCVVCGRAVLWTNHFYGSALTEPCEGWGQ